jgi:hypothetical protein
MKQQIETALKNLVSALPEAPDVAIVLADGMWPYATYPPSANELAKLVGQQASSLSSLHLQLAHSVFGNEEAKYNLYIHEDGTLLTYHLHDVVQLVMLFPAIKSYDGLIFTIERHIDPLRHLAQILT